VDVVIYGKVACVKLHFSVINVKRLLKLLVQPLINLAMETEIVMSMRGVNAIKDSKELNVKFLYTNVIGVNYLVIYLENVQKKDVIVEKDLKEMNALTMLQVVTKMVLSVISMVDVIHFRDVHVILVGLVMIAP